MGRDKKQQRTKGNAQGASSAQAQELLAQRLSESRSATGFIGFSAFSAPASASASASATTATALTVSALSAPDAFVDYNSLPNDLALILRKLAKRDAVTKIKASEELRAYLVDGGEATYEVVLPLWADLYNRLGNDVDRRVRSLAAEVHALVVGSVGKKIAPHLKKVMATWLMSFFDAKEIAKTATECFNTAFPQAKQTDAIKHTARDVLAFIADTTVHKTPETLSDPRFTSPEDMAARYARIVSSCIYVLARIFETLSTEDLAPMQSELMELLNNPAFWKHASSEHVLVRKSVSRFVKTLVERRQDLLEDQVLDSVCGKVLAKAFEEKDGYAIGDLWDAVLSLLQSRPELWTLTGEKIKKPMENKLHHYLRSATHGLCAASYPAVTVLVSLLPEQITAGLPFWHEVLRNFIKGADAGVIDASGWEPFWRAYLDLIYVGTLKLQKSQTDHVVFLRQQFGECAMTFLGASQSKALQVPAQAADMLVSFLVRLSGRQVNEQWVCLTAACEQCLPSSKPLGQLTADRTSQLLVSLKQQVTDTSDDGERSGALRTRVAELVVERLRKSAESQELDRASLQLCSAVLQASTGADEAVQLVTALLDEQLDNMLRSCLQSSPDSDASQDLLYLYVKTAATSGNTQQWPNVMDTVLSTERVDLAAFLIEQTLAHQLNVSSHSSKLEQRLLAHAEADADLIVAVLGKQEIFLSSTAAKAVYAGLCQPVATMSNGQDFDKVQPTLAVLERVLRLPQSYAQAEVVRASVKLWELANSPHLSDDAHRERISACWQAVSNNIRGPALTDEIKSRLTNAMSERFQHVLRDLDHHASPRQLGQMVQHLLAVISTDKAQQQVLHATLLQPDLWQGFVEHHAYSALPLGMTNAALVTDAPQPVAPSAAKDASGLSVFARTVLCLSFTVQQADMGDLLWHAADFWSSVVPGLFAFLIAYQDQQSLQGHWLLTYDAAADVNSLRRWLCGTVLQRAAQIAGPLRLSAVQATSQRHDSSDTRPLEVIYAALVARSHLSHVYLRAATLFLRSVVTAGKELLDHSIAEFAAALVQANASVALLSAFEQSADAGTVLETVRESACHAFLDSQDILSDHALSQLVLANGFGAGEPHHMLVRHRLCSQVISALDDWTGVLMVENETQEVTRQLVVLFHVIQLTAKAVATLDDDLASSEFEEVVSKCWNWLDCIPLILHQDMSNLVLHAVVRVLLQLFELAKQNPSLRRCFGDFEEFIHEKVIDFFFSKYASPLKTQPFEALLDDVSQCLLEVPSKLVLKQKSGDELYGAFYASHQSVMTAAYVLLRRHAGIHMQEMSLQFEVSPDREMESDTRLHARLVDAIKHPQHELDEDSTHDERLSALRSLLAWLILLECFQHATFQIKMMLTDQLKTLDCAQHMLDFVFATLIGSRTATFDLSRWAVDEYYVEGFALESETSFALLSSYVLYKSLVHLPSLVRDWWTKLRNRQDSKGFETLCQTHLSPLIIKGELASLQSADKAKFAEDMSIKVSRMSNTNEIVATYKVEEVSIEMIVSLPNTYPLKQVEVVGGNKAAVSDSRWRSWLLCCQALMSAQNGSILDALVIFQRNVALHFAGQTECAICYSIVGVLDKALPNRSCRTCKNKFHSACLFKF
ncbi:hypothetical protein RI367_007184 [Sorochytrium milnesiophthora]